MFYNFPKITNIKDVEFLRDVDEFIFVEKDWGTVVNYSHMSKLTFPEIKTENDIIRRECRGLMFSKDGKILSRPFHKFFNLGEREETQLNLIDLSRQYSVLIKMDGSMIRPFSINGYIRLGTKMGITTVSMQAETFVSSKSNYLEFFKEMIKNNATPLLEWCSNSNQIVVSYPQDLLVLLAIRDNYSGQYYSLNDLRSISLKFDIPLVSQYENSSINFNELIKYTNSLKNQEGWIIRFDDGHMLKIKSDDYVKMHKAKDNLIREWAVIEMILDEKIDDVKPFLSNEDRIKLETFETAFWEGIKQKSAEWKSEFEYYKSTYNSKKEFAINAAPLLEANLRSALFKVWDLQKNTINFKQLITEFFVRKSLTTQAKINENRHLWNHVSWNFSNNLET